MKLQTIAFLLSALVMSSSFSEGSTTTLSSNQTAVAQPAKKFFKEYHLTGTMTVGIFTYTYDIVVDADICLICRPPKITINDVISASICLRGTSVCGTANFQRSINDGDGYTQKVEMNSTDLDPDVLAYLNSEQFVEDVKTEVQLRETR